MFNRAPYNYDVDAASNEAGLMCLDKSLAQQHELEETDINVIVKRFGVTGMLPQRTLPPLFGDFTDVVDFREAQTKIREAQEAFDALPAEVRFRFGNDPAEFVEFATDEANIDELRKLGLAKAVEAAKVEAAAGGVPGDASPASSAAPAPVAGVSAGAPTK